MKSLFVLPAFLLLSPACSIDPDESMRARMSMTDMDFSMAPDGMMAELTMGTPGRDGRRIRLPVSNGQARVALDGEGGLRMDKFVLAFDRMAVEPPPALAGMDLRLASLEVGFHWPAGQVSWSSDGETVRGEGRAELSLGWSMNGNTMVVPQAPCELRLMATRVPLGENRDQFVNYLTIELPGTFSRSGYLDLSDLLVIAQGQ